jgi:hypothetical protein
MPTNCTSGGINATYFDGISLRYACVADVFAVVDQPSDPPNGVYGQPVVEAVNGTVVPDTGFTSTDTQVVDTIGIEAMVVPQVDSVNLIRNVTEGKKKKMSGTCGARQKIGKNIVEPAWEFTITEMKGMPVSRAFIRDGECWWFMWKDCECNYGEIAFGEANYLQDQLLDTTTEDQELLEVLRIDIKSGPFIVYPDAATCWPLRPICTGGGGTSCACLTGIDPCDCEPLDLPVQE